MNCSDLKANGYSVSGCTNVDAQQAPCDAVAGLPCPEGQGLALSKCQGCAGPLSRRDVGNVNVTTLRHVAIDHAEQGRLDPIENVRLRRYYLYRGGRDSCYTSQSVAHAAELYRQLGARVLFSDAEIPSLHAIPTVATGTPCGTEGNYTEAAPHGLEACNYSGAQAALSWIHAGLNPPAIRQDPSALVRFDQSEFGSSRAGLDLVNGGFAYIPARCRSEACRIHVFAHGCGQQAAAGPTSYAMNDTYPRRAGFNELAESNRFVILYPQLHYGERATCMNEAGDCWDQTGTTGDAYSSKSGAQVAAVMAMIDRLRAQPGV